MTELSWSRLHDLCARAVRVSGGDAVTASALADATVAAERRGNSPVGVQHLFDYLRGLEAGRINGSPNMRLVHDFTSVITVAADDGVAQVAFELARPAVTAAARQTGVAVLSINNAFTVGELGWYTSAIARERLIALAGANSSALMSLYDLPAILTGTNPFSFAIPAQPDPRLIDQASSATAFVRIREAAEAGRPIPPGWALDAAGHPTTDAAAALLGPMLPFGGAKGSNLAVIIELLSVLSGAAFSLDAGKFDSGSEPPRVGLFLLALDPAAFSAGYLQRVEAHLQRLKDDHGIDFGRFVAPVETLRLPEPVQRELLRRAGDQEAQGPRR